MRKPFAFGYVETQPFGVNAAIYEPFGVKGHTGLDLFPLTNDWTIYCVQGGIVIPAPFDATAYGNYIFIRTTSGRIWLYGHLSTRFVKIGDRVERGQRLGVMGNTGNVRSTTGGKGYHLHLGLLPAHPDWKNGFGGFVDPTPRLEELDRMELEHDIFIAAANSFGIQLNDQAALARFATQHNLGIPLKDEFEKTIDGVTYVIQLWSLGVVYCRKGDYENVFKAQPIF